MDHNSLKSSRGKLAVPSISCKNPSGPDEESGWTSYFEDFSKGNIIEPSHCSSSSLGGSSLLSDAASSAAWKFKFSHQYHNNNHHHVVISSSSDKGAPNLPKKLCFKKARTKQISEDDPLEDTASSPVNSPKVIWLIKIFFPFFHSFTIHMIWNFYLFIFFLMFLQYYLSLLYICRWETWVQLIMKLFLGRLMINYKVLW